MKLLMLKILCLLGLSVSANCAVLFFPSRQGKSNLAGFGSHTESAPDAIEVSMPVNLPRSTVGESIVFALPGGDDLTCFISKIYDHPVTNSFTMHGTVNSDDTGNFAISCGVIENDEISRVSCIGNIRPAALPSQQYELRSDSLGLHTIKLVSTSFYERDDLVSVDLRRSLLQQPSVNDEEYASRQLASADSDQHNILDVFVVYTADALAWAGGHDAMNLMIDLAVDEGNEIFVRQLVHGYPV
jgi:hypothetical protein